MGVTYDKARNKYRATTQVNGKTKHIGRFDTKLKATRALNKFRKENTITPLKGEGLKNIGMNGRGELVPYKDEEDLQRKLDGIGFDTALDTGTFLGEPFTIPKEPSLADKIKSVWQNRKKRQDS